MSTPGPLSEKANYEKVERGFLGEGTFGIVRKYRCKRSNEFVAIKKIRLKQAKAGINLSAIREMKTLQELQHPHVIRIRDVFSHNSNINLVLDFMSAELEQIIKDKRHIELTPSHIKSFMLQILDGLAYIHRNWIVHRDIKPGNILLDENKCLKISDFGLARNFGSPGRAMSHQAVTRWYRPPELLFGAKNYGAAVDMWSVGCIFAEFFLRVPYLQGETDIGQLRAIFSALGTPTEEDWPEMKYLPDYFTVPARPAPPLKRTFPDASDDALSLLARMLCFDPLRRISAAEALQDPFFTNAPAPTLQENLPVPDPNRAADSCDHSSMFQGMGPPRALCMESPVAPLHFPTPDTQCRDSGAKLLFPTPDGAGRESGAKLLFPTPDGSGRELDSSFDGKMTRFTPASIDTCGMPRNRPDRSKSNESEDTCGMPRVRPDRAPPDSTERVKIRKRKLDMDQALEDAASGDPTLTRNGESLDDLPVNVTSGLGKV